MYHPALSTVSPLARGPALPKRRRGRRATERHDLQSGDRERNAALNASKHKLNVRMSSARRSLPSADTTTPHRPPHRRRSATEGGDPGADPAKTTRNERRSEEGGPAAERRTNENRTTPRGERRDQGPKIRRGAGPGAQTWRGGNGQEAGRRIGKNAGTEPIKEADRGVGRRRLEAKRETDPI